MDQSDDYSRDTLYVELITEQTVYTYVREAVPNAHSFSYSHSSYNGINYSKLHKTQLTVTTKKTNLIICKYNKVHMSINTFHHQQQNPRYNDEIYRFQVQTGTNKRLFKHIGATSNFKDTYLMFQQSLNINRRIEAKIALGVI